MHSSVNSQAINNEQMHRWILDSTAGLGVRYSRIQKE